MRQRRLRQEGTEHWGIGWLGRFSGSSSNEMTSSYELLPPPAVAGRTMKNASLADRHAPVQTIRMSSRAQRGICFCRGKQIPPPNQTQGRDDSNLALRCLNPYSNEYRSRRFCYFLSIDMPCSITPSSTAARSAAPVSASFSAGSLLDASDYASMSPGLVRRHAGFPAQELGVPHGVFDSAKSSATQPPAGEPP